jgi:hypothetical protein
MKKLNAFLTVAWAVFSLCLAAAAVVSCSDDDDPVDLTLTTLTAGSSDLNAATSPTDVPVDAAIIATFSDDIDAATATDANIVLSREYDGSAVPTAIAVSGNTVTITPNEDLFAGDQYKITFNSGLQSTAGRPMSVLERSFATPGIGIGTAPQSSSQVLYLQFNGTVEDVTANASTVSEQLAYTEDRFGNPNSAGDFRGATAAGNGDIVELSGDDLVNASSTFSIWFKIDVADYDDPNGSRIMFGLGSLHGYFFEVGSGGVDWMKFPTNHKVDPAGTPDHNYGTAWTDFINGGSPVGGQLIYNYSGQISSLVNDDEWHHMALTYDATTSLKTFFIDGVKIMQADIDANTTEWILKELALADMDDTGAALTGVDATLALGFGAGKANTNPDWMKYSTATNTYKGAMDDFRIFDTALTESEVQALFNAEKPQ